MVHLAKHDTAQLIHEVGWKLHKDVTREAFLKDLAYAQDLCFPVYEWRGADRQGHAMRVVWVTTGADGSLLTAYEIQGRA